MFFDLISAPKQDLTAFPRSGKRFPFTGWRLPLFLLTLLQCLVLPDSQAAERLVIGVGRDFYEGSDSRTFLHGSTNTWEGLTYLDRNLEAVPWLAESWHSADEDKEWTFHLRPGVKFHDGTAVDAEEVAASIHRIRSNRKYDPTGTYEPVTAVTALDKTRVVFHLEAPVPHFPKLVAYYSSPVIQPDGFDDAGRIQTLIATGPYRLDRVIPGGEIRLTANKHYWGPKPIYDEVVFKQISDSQTRMMALIAGEIDAIADVGGILPQQMEILSRDPRIQLEKVETATIHMLLFNHRDSLFSESENRLWLSGLIDRNLLVEAFAKGAGVVARDPYTRLCKEYAFGLINTQTSSDIKPSLGMDSPLKILLHGGTLQRWPYIEFAQVIRELLRSYGLKADIDIREAGGYHDALRKGDFHLAVQPYTLMTGDPDFFYSYFIASDGSRNLGYQSLEADRLIASARNETNPEKRRRMYRKLASMVADQLPVLPLYHDVSPYAYRKTAGDLRMDHFFRPVLTR